EGRARTPVEPAGPPRLVEPATYGRLVCSEGARGRGREERVSRLEDTQHPAPGILDPPVGTLEIEPLALQGGLAHAHAKIAVLEEQGHAGLGRPVHHYGLRLGGLAG